MSRTVALHVRMADVNRAFELAARVNGGSYTFALAELRSSQSVLRRLPLENLTDVARLEAGEAHTRLQFDHTKIDGRSALLLLDGLIRGLPTRWVNRVDIAPDPTGLSPPRPLRFRSLMRCIYLLPQSVGSQKSTTAYCTIPLPSGRPHNFTRGLVAALHQMSHRRTSQRFSYSAVAVPVAASPMSAEFLQDPAIGNMSASFLSTVRSGVQIEPQMRDFFERAAGNRAFALARLQKIGSLNACTIGLLASLLQAAGYPRETALVSRLDTLSYSEILRSSDLFFEVPNRSRRSVSIGLMRYADRVNLTASGRTDTAQLVDICDSIMIDMQFDFRERRWRYAE